MEPRGPLAGTGRARPERARPRPGSCAGDAALRPARPTRSTSDLARALETAEIAATATGLGAGARSGLREVDVGDWRGLTRDDVSRRDPDGYRRWLGGEAGWNGGETYAEMHARVVATVERLVAASAVGRIAVISHGGAVRALAANAVGLPKHDRLRIEGARNCSLTTLNYDHDGVRLVGYNDDGHLPPAPDLGSSRSPARPRPAAPAVASRPEHRSGPLQ